MPLCPYALVRPLYPTSATEYLDTQEITCQGHKHQTPFVTDFSFRCTW